MIPVFQTDMTPSNGNCMAACVASILEMPLEDMPNPHGEHGEWFHIWNTWLAPRNMQLLTFLEGGDWHPYGYAILAGKSPRHDCNHAVVGYNGDIVHDPHPDGTGISTREDWTIIIPIDPSKPIVRE